MPPKIHSLDELIRQDMKAADKLAKSTKAKRQLKALTGAPSEADIQDSIMSHLRMHGWLVVRINSQSTLKGEKRFVRSYIIQGLGASAGFPDVMAFKNHGGLIMTLLIEVKTAKGKVTPPQAAFHRFAKQFGIIVNVIRSPEEMEKLIKQTEAIAGS